MSHYQKKIAHVMKAKKHIKIDSFDALVNAINELRAYYGQGRYFEIKVYEQTRSSAQNMALHAWCRDVASVFLEEGIDKREFFKEGYFRMWNEHDIKEDIWRPVQKAECGTTSTTELTRSEVDAVFNIINLKISDMGLHIPFIDRDAF